MRPNWNEYFMTIAKIVSTRSTCNSRPTGAVLVRDKQILSTGYNGSMPGAPHCSDQLTADGKPFCFRRSIDAPEDDKYNYCRASHAEANAVSRAARLGISLEGSTCFVTLAPCYVCLKLLAVAGVRHIYYEHGYESTKKERDEHWRQVIAESPIETFEQLKVSERMVKRIAASLIYPTSRRRLSEDYEVIVGIDKQKPGRTIDGFISEKQFRTALVECLCEKGQTELYSGPPLRIQASGDQISSHEDPDRDKILAFLASNNMMRNHSEVLPELASALVEQMSESGDAEIRAYEDNIDLDARIAKSRLEMDFRFALCDIWNDPSAMAGAVKMIAEQLLDYLSEKIGSPLKLGASNILIDKPFFMKDDLEAVKKYLANG